MSLTKRDIARAIHEELPTVSIREGVELVDLILESIRRGLVGRDKVMITNFGSFENVRRAPRRGVDPSTGEELVIPSRRAVTFSPAPALEDATRRAPVGEGEE